MKILPLKSEIACVVNLLESGDFEDSTALARELVKVVATELAKRETIALVHNAGPPFVFLWPFYYEGDARKFHERTGTLGETKCHLIKLRSPLVDDERRAARAAEEQERAKGMNWPNPDQQLTIRSTR